MTRKRQSIASRGSFFQSQTKPKVEPNRVTSEVKRIMTRESEAEKPVCVFRAHFCPTANQIRAFSDEKGRRHLPASYADELWDIRHPEEEGELRGLPGGVLGGAIVKRPPMIFEESVVDDGPSSRQANMATLGGRRPSPAPLTTKGNGTGVADALIWDPPRSATSSIGHHEVRRSGSSLSSSSFLPPPSKAQRGLEEATSYQRACSSLLATSSSWSQGKARRTAAQYMDQMGPMLQLPPDPFDPPGARSGGRGGDDLNHRHCFVQSQSSRVSSSQQHVARAALAPAVLVASSPCFHSGAQLTIPSTLAHDSFTKESALLPDVLRPPTEHRLRKSNDAVDAKMSKLKRAEEFAHKWAGRRKWNDMEDVSNML